MRRRDHPRTLSYLQQPWTVPVISQSEASATKRREDILPPVSENRTICPLPTLATMLRTCPYMQARGIGFGMAADFLQCRFDGALMTIMSLPSFYRLVFFFQPLHATDLVQWFVLLSLCRRNTKFFLGTQFAQRKTNTSFGQRKESITPAWRLTGLEFIRNCTLIDAHARWTDTEARTHAHMHTHTTLKYICRVCRQNSGQLMRPSRLGSTSGVKGALQLGIRDCGTARDRFPLALAVPSFVQSRSGQDHCQNLSKANKHAKRRGRDTRLFNTSMANCDSRYLYLGRRRFIKHMLNMAPLLRPTLSACPSPCCKHAERWFAFLLQKQCHR